MYSKFSFETLPCYSCKCWHWSLSLSIHYLICIWTTCEWNLNEILWSKMHKMLIFWPKNKTKKQQQQQQQQKNKQTNKQTNDILKAFFDKALTPFWKTFLKLKQLLFSEKKILILILNNYLSVFLILWLSDKCNQVKRYTKHGQTPQVWNTY